MNRCKKYYVVLAAFCCLAYSSVRAQTVIDRFRPNPDDAVRVITQQSNGRLIIGGYFTTIAGAAHNYIVRLYIDGTIDASFSASANDGVRTMIIQSDGKIILGGDFQTMNGEVRNHIARLESDGSLDSGFNPGAGDDVRVVTIQSDGKILVGGYFTTLAGQASKYIGRLNADGSFDSSFTAQADGVAGMVRKIAVQPDGRIIIAGSFTTVNGQARNNIASLNTDGTLDTSFNPDANGMIWELLLQNDGKIIIAGDFNQVGGTALNYIARLNADGSVDASFNPGTGANFGISCGILQTNGKILLGGVFNQFNGAAHLYSVRLNTDGSVDTTYDDGIGFDNEVSSLYQQSDGKIVAGGAFTKFFNAAISRPYLLRMYASEGFPDATLILATPLNAMVYAAAVERNESILIGGDFTTADGVAHQRIARIDTHGYVDSSFTASATADHVQAIVVQPDDKIIIGGYFTMVNGVAHTYLARLLSDGTTDPAFTSGIIAGGGVRGVALQPDGKIVIGGGFTTIDGASYNGIARLNTNGVIDTSFNPGDGVGVVDYINSVALQPDGKILVGGTFTSLGGQAINRIGRLHSDGSVDAVFNPNAGDEVRCITVQPDGKILVGGLFTTMGGAAYNRIVRIDTNGNVDASFSLADGANASIRSIGIQCDGKIIVGGGFTTIGGDATRKYITRLNSDGSLDASFTFSEYPNSSMDAVMIQNDGKIVCGGDFINWSDSSHDYLARVATINAAIQSLSVSGMGESITWLRSGASPELTRTIFEYSFDGTTWSELGAGTRVSGGWQILGLTLPPNTNVYVRATGLYYGSYFGAGGSVLDSTKLIYLTTPSPVITNISGVVTGYYGAANYTLSGTNNVNVTGTMWWHNNLGGSSSFTATNPWSVTVTGLSVGANTITICGSNTVGDVGSNSITIVQHRNDHMAADFDGDVKADPSYYNGTNWYEWLSSQNYARASEYDYAMPGTFPVAADFDGDRLADPAVYNNQAGTWYVWLSSSLYWRVGPLAYGVPGSAPVPADFDGDRLADFTVFSAGNWYAWLSTAGYLGFGPFAFGAADSIPIAGDFDNDRKADPAVFLRGNWYAWFSSINYYGVGPVTYGEAEALPVVADFDGDNICDLATVNGTTWYAWLSTANYMQLGPFTFDASGWRFLE